MSIAAGAGMRHEDIAIGMEISLPTLTKHYAAELTVGATQRRFEVLAAMHAAAKKGSSSAARTYMAMEPQAAAPNPERQGKPAKVGKKEQAQADAGTAAAGTEWSELLPAGVTAIRR